MKRVPRDTQRIHSAAGIFRQRRVFPERIDALFSTCSGFRWLVRSSRVANKDGIFSGVIGAVRRVIYRDAKIGFVRKPNQNANVTEKFIPDSGSHLTQKAVSAHARLNESS